MPEVTKQFIVDRPIEDVWEFFNSPDDLAPCVPGCESVEQIDEDTFNAEVRVKVAYTNLTFDTKINITDRDEPTSMTVDGEAQPSGRMPGSATVNGTLELVDEGDSTAGTMTIQFAIRGRLGSLGESAFTHKCEEITGQFIDNVKAELEGVKTT